MRVFVAILAAGLGSRFGSDKTQIVIGGRPLWRWSYDTFKSHPRIDGIGLMGSSSNLEALQAVEADFAAMGRASRQETSALACNLVPESFDAVLIHDAARPFISAEVISSVIDAIERVGAAAPAVPINDTLRRRTDSGLELVSRKAVVAMQTPQGAWRDVLLKAHALATHEGTDEITLIEQLGHPYELVLGEQRNIKITRQEDLELARGIMSPVEVRTGFGYDIHAFSADPARKLVLGGVAFEGVAGLDGHSDADVLIHAAVDAMLGAAALGDIGQHFPNTDPRWKNEPSSTFLRRAAQLLCEAGWRPVNLDVTLIAERPKIMAKAVEIRQSVAEMLDISVDAVSVKATTNEGLGALGSGQGIAAHAVATICR